jgi:hypothetical protein
VEVDPESAEELLQAADQYMLEGLKRLCEASLSGRLSVDSLAATYELSENFNAPQLGRRCVLHALEHYESMVRPWCLIWHWDSRWQTHTMRTEVPGGHGGVLRHTRLRPWKRPLPQAMLSAWCARPTCAC